VLRRDYVLFMPRLLSTMKQGDERNDFELLFTDNHSTAGTCEDIKCLVQQDHCVRAPVFH
jgi:hypothetical protein